MTRRVSMPALVAHHLRSRSGGAITVAVLVFVLALLATTAPLAASALADASLRDRLASLGPVERDVQTTSYGFPQTGPGEADLPPETRGVWGGFVEAVETVRSSADPVLQGLLGPAHTVALDSGNPVWEDPRTRALTLAFDPFYEGEIQLAQGRMPEVASEAPVGEFGSGIRMEVITSTESAQQMEWAVGTTRTVGRPEEPIEVVLVGTFDAIDPAGDYWQHVPSVLFPQVFDDGNQPRKVTATGYAHPASLTLTYPLIGKPDTTVWYPFDTAGVTASAASEIAAALRKFTAVSHTVGTSAQGIGILSLRFTADVTAAIEGALAQEAATASMITMVIAGPIGVAAAVLILGCRLILERRRPSLRLLSARGASTGQLRRLLGLEGMVVGLLPAVLGAAAAVALALSAVDVASVGDTAGLAVFLPAVLLGLAPLGILALLAGSAVERQARTDLGRKGSRLRLTAEGAVLVLAAVAVTLLLLRGYGAGGIDPLQAAVPLLLALVACLFTLRLYPTPLRWLLARSRRSPGATGFLGPARALREPSIGLVPVLALVVGVSVAVSSGVLLSTLQEGIEQSAQAQVGADARITGGTFTTEQLAEVREIEGIAAATGISGAEPATLDVDGQKRPTSVFVVDAADLREVQGDGAGLLPPGVSLEPTGTPMPIVVAAATAKTMGEASAVRVDSTDADVVGVSTGPSPIGTRENWVAIDSSYAEAVVDRDPSDRTILIRFADGASIDGVDSDLRAVLGAGIRIDSADEIAAEIRSGPAVEGVRDALWAATAVAAMLSALAIVMTLTLAAGPRRRMIALLRTLGARPRIATSLLLWEIGPPAIAAVLAGTIFGALIPLVVLAGVDLRSFTGSSIQPVYFADAATLVLTVGGFVLLAAVFTTAALLVSRRVRVANVLRTVEEG